MIHAIKINVWVTTSCNSPLDCSENEKKTIHKKTFLKISCPQVYLIKSTEFLKAKR